MREDQYLKLQQLEEKLLDVFISEADPSSWPGQGISLGAMDAKTRGDLYWVRKTAASALVLATKVQGVIGYASGRSGSPDGGQPDGASIDPTSAAGAAADQVDAAIAKAEREAERLMRELQAGASAGKAAFDRKVHGRATRSG